MTEYSRLTITTTTDRGTRTEHWSAPHVQIRTMIAEYIASHGLYRNSYSNAETLYRDNVAVGSYAITPMGGA